MPAVIRVSVQPQFVAFVFPDQTGASYLNAGDGDGELLLVRRGEAEPLARLRVTFPEPDRMVLEGPFGQQQVKMTLRRIPDPPPKAYALRSKGFNWIQEFPDNR
jgi:hypothetical protein